MPVLAAPAPCAVPAALPDAAAAAAAPLALCEGHGAGHQHVGEARRGRDELPVGAVVGGDACTGHLGEGGRGA